MNFEAVALSSLAALQSISADQALIDLDASGLSAGDFQEPKYQAIFAAIELRVRAKEPIDAVALTRQLPSFSRSEIVEIVSSGQPINVRSRLATVRDDSLRRQYVNHLRVVAGILQDKSQPLEQGVNEAAKLLGGWKSETKTNAAMTENLMSVIDELDAIQRGVQPPVLQTGIEAWDAVLGGLPPTLCVVGALPGVGKSSLLAGIARNLAMRGQRVGIISLEDERSWVTKRMLAEASGVPVFVLANRPLTLGQMEAVGSAAGPLYSNLGHILCDDRGRLSPGEVVASCRRMILDGAKALLIDHLGEIRLERSERHDLDIADALSQIRDLAKTTHTPIVIAAHLRRREGLNVDAEPRLTDFAFSSAVERQARLAVGLFRAGEDRTKINVAVLKQTQGVAGFTFALNVNHQAAIVTQTKATDDMRRLYE